MPLTLASGGSRSYLSEGTAEEGSHLVGITSLADSILRGVENVGTRASETLFEPVIRLGVTGLARAGKTVFITSLVTSLRERERMHGLAAAQEGRIAAAYLQPQPDDTVPRFDYEAHWEALTSRPPHWPESTRAISELRLSLRVRPSGLLSGIQGARVVHLDIVDYPGEWLLDLVLLEKSYAEWSQEVLSRLAARKATSNEAARYLALAEAEDAADALEEPRAQALARAFTDYLAAARDSGAYDVTPGRFLLPGDLAGSPVLTFAPLAEPARVPRRSLWREMERRFDAYKAQVVRPFFRDHFARIDRQIVLLDVLGAIHKGPAALEDMRAAMGDILGAFRPGRNALLARLLRGRRVERILFAATKADHLHHSEHARLAAITAALTEGARERARFAGARTESMAIASLRATVEEIRRHEGQGFPCVRGTLLETGRQAALYPGRLPEDPAALLGPARRGAQTWLGEDYEVMNFAPPELALKPGEGPPHIRLDRAAEFLIGDRL